MYIYIHVYISGVHAGGTLGIKGISLIPFSPS